VITDPDPNRSGFVAALDANLNPLWQRSVHELEVHADADRLRVSHLRMLGDTLVLAGTVSRGEDSGVFVDRLDAASGGLTESHLYPGPSSLTALSVLSDGSVLFGGILDTGTDLGGGPLLSEDGEGPFLAHFAENGDHLWSTLFCSGFAASVRGVRFVGGAVRGLFAFNGHLEFGSSRVEVPERAFSSAFVVMPPSP
jgi:hypothetical protein